MNNSSMPSATSAVGHASAARPSRLEGAHSARSRLARAGSKPAPRREVLLGCHGLQKSYRKGQVVIPVLRGVDFGTRDGQFTAIVGQSGSGKSTLLHLLATLDAPDAGQVSFEGHRIDNLPAAGRDILRNRHFGMVFQFYHLLPELTALENVLLPCMIAAGVLRYWRSKAALRRRAPKELSGGEMQRVAIARALIAEPKVLLADEPTGNLDRRTGEEIMHILRSLNDERNLTIVMVTHDPLVAQQADRTVRLVEGRIEDSQE
jgi:lipoprotein-releasing system ATP-binding protein